MTAAAPEAQLTAWETFEVWLYDRFATAPGSFVHDDVRIEFGVDGTTASRLIQAYLSEQRRENSRTLFVLKRDGRTAAAVWSVGERTADARAIARTAYEDIRVKLMRAFQPDLERLADRNPRAARWATAKIEAVLDGALKVLAASLEIDDDD